MKPGEMPEVSWGDAYVMTGNSPDRISGKIYEIIEAMGLQNKQEEATKSLVQKVIWEEIYQHSVHISEKRHTEIRKALGELLSHSQNCTPNPII